MRIAWAIPCRYAEVNEGFATIVGGGANVYVVPAAALPTELAVTIATQIAGGEEELGHPHHLRGLVLGPDMQPTGEPLDVPDLEIPAGEHKPSGWEGTIVIPIVMHWTVEEPGTYTIQLSIDDRNTTVAIHVETPEEEPG